MQDRVTIVSKAQIRQLLVELFEHQALLLRGILSDGCVPDRVGWDLVRHLDASLRRVMRRLENIQETAEDTGQPPHPAVAAFMARLDAYRPDTTAGDPVVRRRKRAARQVTGVPGGK